MIYDVSFRTLDAPRAAQFLDHPRLSADERYSLQNNLDGIAFEITSYDLDESEHLSSAADHLVAAHTIACIFLADKTFFPSPPPDKNLQPDLVETALTLLIVRCLFLEKRPYPFIVVEKGWPVTMWPALAAHGLNACITMDRNEFIEKRSIDIARELRSTAAGLSVASMQRSLHNARMIIENVDLCTPRIRLHLGQAFPSLVAALDNSDCVDTFNQYSFLKLQAQ